MKTQRISLRISQQEKRLIVKASKRAEMSVSEYMIKATLAMTWKEMFNQPVYRRKKDA